MNCNTLILEQKFAFGNNHDFNFSSFIIKVKAMGLRRISDRKEREVDLYSTYI